VGTGAAKGRWGLLVIVLHLRLVLVGWEMVEAEGVDSGGGSEWEKRRAGGEESVQ
jgi:hypothetical protein